MAVVLQCAVGFEPHPLGHLPGFWVEYYTIGGAGVQGTVNNLRQRAIT